LIVLNAAADADSKDTNLHLLVLTGIISKNDTAVTKDVSKRHSCSQILLKAHADNHILRAAALLESHRIHLLSWHPTKVQRRRSANGLAEEDEHLHPTCEEDLHPTCEEVDPSRHTVGGVNVDEKIQLSSIVLPPLLSLHPTCAPFPPHPTCAFPLQHPTGAGDMEGCSDMEHDTDVSKLLSFENLCTLLVPPSPRTLLVLFPYSTLLALGIWNVVPTWNTTLMSRNYFHSRNRLK
jgi:hypothetical protein